MNKIPGLVKNGIEVVGASELIKKTVTTALSYGEPKIVVSFAHQSLGLLERLPNIPYAQYAAPLGFSAFIVVATRVWDAVGNYLFLPADKAQATCCHHLAKEIFSAGMTVLTGAAAGAIYLAATGPVTVPAVVSVAALAAIVWMTTKAGDAALCALKAIVANLKKCCSAAEPQENEHSDQPTYINVTLEPFVYGDKKKWMDNQRNQKHLDNNQKKNGEPVNNQYWPLYH